MDKQKEKKAIEYLRLFEPEAEPYYLCYSGGKDSDCIRILAQLAGVKHEIHHNHTTVDAPETVYYVRSIPGVQIDYPHTSMWELIVKKGMPPTRLVRYCCEKLKERGGTGKMKITGVRWAESNTRKENSDLIKIIGSPKSTQRMADDQGIEYKITPKGGIVLNADNAKTRRFVESCYRTRSTMVNPIIDWTDKDVWEFLHHYGCKSNPLYQCGYSRIGCIGCPMQRPKGMKKDFDHYPIYRANYIKAFDRMITARKERGLTINEAWADGEHVMKWWLGENPLQVTMEQYLAGNDLQMIMEGE